MSYSLTYVEIDIPAFAPESPVTESTLRFAIAADFLPVNDIEAIPSIKSIQMQPTIVSLGENLGQRATVTVTFEDHRHRFNGEAFTSGTFWGKFRARYGLKLRGRALRLIRGTLGQSLDDMETRHFIIESTDGPNFKGEYKIIGKDVLKATDPDRAQAPVISNGFLVAGITAVATSATLSPSGIGNAEYPASGYVAIGGKEIAAFTRSADLLTLTRAQFNTVAQAHSAQDRVQLCLEYDGVDPADIIYDLLVTYSGVDEDWITLADWQEETDSYLGVVYTALVAEPTSCSRLISELIEQAALAVWWDDVNQQIRLQVLRAIPTTVDIYDQGNTLMATLEVAEQPEKRLTEVQFYFGKINPLVKDDEDDNYRSSAIVSDPDAVIEYGGAAIKKIRSRWVAAGGRTIAETAGNKLLGRFRDPPRRVNFHLLRYAGQEPVLGSGYQLGGAPFQAVEGDAELIPIQITRLNPFADRFEVEAEEMLWTAFGGDIDPTIRTIIFDADINNVDLREVHDDLYPDPESGDIVNAIVRAGIIVGSNSVTLPAFDVGDWPAGVTINLQVIGRIQGHGAQGGAGAVSAGLPGQAGGTALYTRAAINLDVDEGEIFGGGGGGGGGGIIGTGTIGGGGGGAGKEVGVGGAGQFGGADGSAGTTEAGGSGGAATAGGGAGGGPGLAGSTGGTGAGGGTGGAGGAAGAAIDGMSLGPVTVTEGPGDIRGGQVN